jgi:hypothetical protein
VPVSKHYAGHGDEVMKSMTKTYGAKKAKQVFYATEHKRKPKVKHAATGGY